MIVKARIAIGSKDRTGKKRKIIQIRDLDYDEFEFGEVVVVSKID